MAFHGERCPHPLESHTLPQRITVLSAHRNGSPRGAVPPPRGAVPLTQEAVPMLTDQNQGEVIATSTMGSSASHWEPRPITMGRGAPPWKAIPSPEGSKYLSTWSNGHPRGAVPPPRGSSAPHAGSGAHAYSPHPGRSSCNIHHGEQCSPLGATHPYEEKWHAMGEVPPLESHTLPQRLQQPGIKSGGFKKPS